MARTEAVALRREATAAAWWRINATALLFMGPALLLVLVFFLAPVVITFTMSLTDLATSTGLSNWQWIGLENFARIFRSQFWLTILANTIVYVAVVLTFNVLVGLGVALLSMHMEPKAGGVFRALWLLRRISPSVVYALLWVWAAASPPFGMLNYIVAPFGLEQRFWLQSDPWLIVILINGFVGASFRMLIFTSAIQSLPGDLCPAARVAQRAPGTFRWSSLVPYAVLALWTLPIIVLYVWLFYSSFFPRIEGFRPIGAFTFDNWRFLWDPQSVPQMRNRPAILPLTLNTFIFSAMTSAVGLLISSMAGYAFSRLRFKGRRLMLGGVLLLHSFPSVTLLIALFIVLRTLGLYDKFVGVILVQTAFALPFGIWIMKGFFDNVPWDLEMSALVDGAGRFRTWLRIMLPLVKPGLLALAVLLFVEGWNQFLLPFVFMPSGSQQTLSTLVKGILGEGRFVDYGLLTAAW